jgi:DnaJ domain
MTVQSDDSQLQVWKRAYQLLGVAEIASPFVIKQAYRKMMKRWHPDKESRGGNYDFDSTRMSQLVNEAYAEIADAPLRYRSSATYSGPPVSPPAPEISTVNSFPEKIFWLPHPEQIEFWVRLISGGIFGAVLSATTAMNLFDTFRPIVLAMSFGAIACAYSAVRYGDKFWYWIFGKSWLF